MRILLFIILKVIEITSVVFVPYWLGKLTLPIWKKMLSPCSLSSRGDSWAVGVMTILALTVICLLGYLLIQANWQLAGKLL